MCLKTKFITTGSQRSQINLGLTQDYIHVPPFPTSVILLGYVPGGSEVKASACNVGDLGSIPGLGRSPGEGNGNPLQYSCLVNPMDGGAWWATVHGVAKSRTRLSDFTSLHFMLHHNIATAPSIQSKSKIVFPIWYLTNEVA